MKDDLEEHISAFIIDVRINYDKWHSIDFDIVTFSEFVCKKTLLFEKKPDDQGISVNVLLTDDFEVKNLNKQFRKKNKPTNVLAFPNTSEHDDSIGDIVLSYDTIHTEAQIQKKDFKNHFTHILMHGLLHLLGYDHTEESVAKIMEKKEITILKQYFNINNPYENN